MGVYSAQLKEPLVELRMLCVSPLLLLRHLVFEAPLLCPTLCMSTRMLCRLLLSRNISAALKRHGEAIATLILRNFDCGFSCNVVAFRIEIRTGLVDTIDGVNISDVLVQLKADIVRQLGRSTGTASPYSTNSSIPFRSSSADTGPTVPRGTPPPRNTSGAGLGFTAWIACDTMGVASRDTRIASAGCDPTSPTAAGQQAVDIDMVADQALAVRYQVCAAALGLTTLCCPRQHPVVHALHHTAICGSCIVPDVG